MGRKSHENRSKEAALNLRSHSLDKLRQIITTGASYASHSLWASRPVCGVLAAWRPWPLAAAPMPLGCCRSGARPPGRLRLRTAFEMAAPARRPMAESGTSLMQLKDRRRVLKPAGEAR
jgi:hypothetical protein